MNTVEQQLSPRAKDFFNWSDNHVGGFLKPTRKATAKHDDETRRISTDDLVELADFDLNAGIRNMTGCGETATFN